MANGSWLPPARATDEDRRGFWAPRDLPVRPGRLSYLVVEEIIGDALGLAVCDWPEVDTKGRLCFRTPATLVGVDRAWLEQQLREHREPTDISERPLRIGDSFAVSDVEIGPGEEEPELTIAAWQPPIFDITAQARDAAKTALYAAVAPVLDPEQARDVNVLIED